MAIEDWWRDLARYRSENPGARLCPDLDWDPDIQREGDDMAPVARVDIYRFFSKFRQGKYLTPAERVEIDKLLDDLGAKR